MLLGLSGCSTMIAIDACTGFKKVVVRDAIVQTSPRWWQMREAGTLAGHQGDVLTQSTAGQIGAHNKYYERHCDRP